MLFMERHIFIFYNKTDNQITWSPDVFATFEKDHFNVMEKDDEKRTTEKRALEIN